MYFLVTFAAYDNHYTSEVSVDIKLVEEEAIIYLSSSHDIR